MLKRFLSKVEKQKPQGLSTFDSSSIPTPKLDVRAIVQNSSAKARNVVDRNLSGDVTPDLERIARLYGLHKDGLSTLNELRHRRAQISNGVSQRNLTQEETSEAIANAKKVKLEITDISRQVHVLEQEMNELALSLPNDTHPDVPRGPSSKAVVLDQYSGPLDLLPADNRRDHVVLCAQLGWLDLIAGAKVTGASWAYLLDEAALLEQALISYALSVALRHEFRHVSTPDVIRTDVALRCGFNPREERTALQQSYTLGPSHLELTLSGTAEIPLAGLYANSIIDLAYGPKKLVAVGKAFRVEAGSRGKESRGLYRLHQFSKVEMFVLCDREHSEDAMLEMLTIQKEIVKGLNIPYRVLDMPTEELGASAYRKFDIEAWMPGRGDWGEISSLSNCTDFQSRRLHIRHRPSSQSGEGHDKIPFVHTLNGTAAAIPRLMIALLENGAQFEEESTMVKLIALPKVLKPFWLQPKLKTSVQWV